MNIYWFTGWQWLVSGWLVVWSELKTLETHQPTSLVGWLFSLRQTSADPTSEVMTVRPVVTASMVGQWLGK